jgi:hypothetical protein
MTPIHIFAEMQSTELLQVLAVIGGMLAGFYGVFKIMNATAEKDRNADRAERAAFIQALSNVASTNKEIAVATKRGADEAKERNGHLAEISQQNKEQIIEAVHGLIIDKQTVHNQFVENEQVNHKEES